jgi:hypothetical protein
VVEVLGGHRALRDAVADCQHVEGVAADAAGDAVGPRPCQGFAGGCWLGGRPVYRGKYEVRDEAVQARGSGRRERGVEAVQYA